MPERKIIRGVSLTAKVSTCSRSFAPLKGERRRGKEGEQRERKRERERENEGTVVGEFQGAN